MSGSCSPLRTFRQRWIGWIGRLCSPIALASLLAAPAPAWADFEPARTLSTPLNLTNGSVPVFPSQVAVNARGEGIFVWFARPLNGHRYLVQAMFRAADGTFGPVENVVIMPTGDPHESTAIKSIDVAIDGAGNAIIVWRLIVTRPGGEELQRMEARTRSASGVLGPVEQVLPFLHSWRWPPSIEVVSNDRGDALIVWHSRMRLRSRFRSAAGEYGPQLLIAPPGFSGRIPSVAMNNSGTAVIAWQEEDLSGYQIVRWIRAQRISGGVLDGDVVTLSALPESPAGSPDVAIDANGNAIVAWPYYVRVVARRYMADNSLGPTSVLFDQRCCSANVELAVSPDGRAVVIWETRDDEIKARGISATDAIEWLHSVSPPGVPVANANIGMADDGTAWISWEHHVDTAPVIWVRPRLASGALGPAQQISGRVSAASEMAVGAGGDVLVTWRRHFNGQVRIQGTAGP